MSVYILNLFPSKEIDGPEVLKWRGNNVPNPLRKGDTVIVIAHFGNYNSDGVAVPIAQYFGLSLGACLNADIVSMEARLRNQGYRGILLNISRNTTPGEDDFFTNAVTYQEPVLRGGQTRNLTYMVQMIFNPGTKAKTTLRNNPEVNIVADYGDPHENGSQDIKVDLNSF